MESQEKYILKTEDKSIAVSIIRKNVKSIRLKIDKDANVKLVTPYTVPYEELTELIESRRNWIREKLAAVANRTYENEDKIIKQETKQQKSYFNIKSVL